MFEKFNFLNFSFNICKVVIIKLYITPKYNLSVYCPSILIIVYFIYKLFKLEVLIDLIW